MFLNYFYKHCMHLLMAPLMAQTTTDKISRGLNKKAFSLPIETIVVLILIVELYTVHNNEVLYH